MCLTRSKHGVEPDKIALLREKIVLIFKKLEEAFNYYRDGGRNMPEYHKFLDLKDTLSELDSRMLEKYLDLCQNTVDLYERVKPTSSRAG